MIRIDSLLFCLCFFFCCFRFCYWFTFAAVLLTTATATEHAEHKENTNKLHLWVYRSQLLEERSSVLWHCCCSFVLRLLVCIFFLCRSFHSEFLRLYASPSTTCDLLVMCSLEQTANHNFSLFATRSLSYISFITIWKMVLARSPHITRCSFCSFEWFGSAVCYFCALIRCFVFFLLKICYGLHQPQFAFYSIYNNIIIDIDFFLSIPLNSISLGEMKKKWRII